MDRREIISLFFKGLAIGTADSVPGVSGGTIAFISGIYTRLLEALRNCHPGKLPLLWREGPGAFWRSIHGTFLLTLALGILTALILMANLVLHLLETRFVLVMAFFLGLVIASCWLMRNEPAPWTASRYLAFIAGFTFTVLITMLNPASGSQSLVYLFLSGALAICAMILPGMSGAFILLLLGVYEYVLDALRSVQLDIIVVFAAGCLLGLMAFSHLLSWVLRRFPHQSYAFLIGMMAASIIVLWPWSREPELIVVAEILPALLAVAAGTALILAFARFARSTQTGSTQTGSTQKRVDNPLIRP